LCFDHCNGFMRLCSIIVRVAEKHRECELRFRAGVSCQCRFLCYVSRARVADQGGLDQTLDCWTVDSGHCQNPVLKKNSWPQTRSGPVPEIVQLVFDLGPLGVLARGAKFAESETSYWLKSDKSTGPIIILSKFPILSNILFIFFEIPRYMYRSLTLKGSRLIFAPA